MTRLWILLLLSGCGNNPPPAKTFGSMLGAQPACVAFCRVEQTITADSTSTPAPTDASMTVTSMEGAVVNK